MTTATLYIASTVSSTVTSPANVIGAPDGTFTADTTKKSWNYRGAFETVGGTTEPTGTHSFTIRARKSGTGGSDVTIESCVIYDGASSFSIGASTTVSSATGQDVTFTLDGTLLTSIDGIEISVTGSGGGGGPNERGCEIDAITWNATYNAVFGNPMNVYQSGVWVQGYLKYYNGTAWTGQVLKRWDGTQWVIESNG